MKIARLFILILLAPLAACNHSQKLTKFAKERLLTYKPVSPAENNLILIKANGLDHQDSLVTFKQVKSQFIPALLFWKYDYRYHAELQQKWVSDLFISDILEYSESLNLISKLQGKKLELSIERIPHSFAFVHQETVVILIFSYITQGGVFYVSEPQDLKITYNLIGEKGVEKTGQLFVPNGTKSIQNILKSTKKFTWEYIDTYRQNCREMSKVAVKMLVERLERT